LIVQFDYNKMKKKPDNVADKLVYSLTEPM